MCVAARDASGRRAGDGGAGESGGRTMKRILSIAGALALALALAGAMSAASAQPGKSGERDMRDPAAQEMPRQGGMGRQSGMRGRDMRPGEDMQMRRGPHHMSPEERQQLRQDIRNHGRDVYGDPRRRDERRR